MEPPASVEAVKQDRHVFLCFARWPAADIEVLRSEHQSSILYVIDVVYDFASVDIPDLLDLLPEQFPTGYHKKSPMRSQPLNHVIALLGSTHGVESLRLFCLNRAHARAGLRSQTGISRRLSRSRCGTGREYRARLARRRVRDRPRDRARLYAVSRRAGP